MIKNLFERLAHWYSTPKPSSLERHLTGASNVADVERLLREWESCNQRQLPLY